MAKTGDIVAKLRCRATKVEDNPGLSVLLQEAAKEIDGLRGENAQLREQIAHIRRWAHVYGLIGSVAGEFAFHVTQIIGAAADND